MKSIDYDGKPISAPGMWAKVGLDRYHGNLCDGPSISSSGLRSIFLKSPAHYWDTSYLNPQRSDHEDDKESFVLGRAVHHLILGEPFFAKLFVIRPAEMADEEGEIKPWHGGRNVCKKWLAEQEKTGRTVLIGEQVERIKGMALSLGKHPLIRAGVLNGLIERSLVFQDKETGVWVKARPDAIPTDSGDFGELKTARGIGDDADRAMRTYRYDMQASVMRMAARTVLNMDMSSFSLVFVESKRPYCVDVVQIDKVDIDEAEHDVRAALKVFAHCLKTKEWFGPTGSQRDARTAFFPEQMRERAKFRREFLGDEIRSATT